MLPIFEATGLVALIWIVIVLLFGRVFTRALLVLFTDRRFVRLFVLVLVILIFGAHTYHRLEGWSYLNALYFTIITLTTVGYGDLAPTTDAAKVFTTIYILFGLGVLGGLIAILTDLSEKWSKRHFRVPEEVERIEETEWSHEKHEIEHEARVSSATGDPTSLESRK